MMPTNHFTMMPTNPHSTKERNTVLLVLTFLNSVGTSVLWNGMSFVLANQFGYPAWKTMLVYIATALVYIAAATSAGPILRRMRGRLSARGLVRIAFLIEASPLPFVFWLDSETTLLIAAFTSSIGGALLWPIMESYVAGGRHGHDLRRAIGVWCIVWMIAVTFTLGVMGPLFLLDDVARAVILGIIATGLISLAISPWLTVEPAEHQAEHHSVPQGYHAQLRSARVLLPVSYLLVSALAAMLPYVLASHHLPETWQTPLAATWLLVRALFVAVLALTHWWHGRWNTLLASGLLLVAGFALVSFSPSVTLVVVGLIAFGIGHAIAYYAALYYALRVGAAEVDAGGMHEALIGAGFVVGPLVAAGGLALGGDAAMAAAVLGTCVIASIPAVRPWFIERRSHRQSQPQGS
ncbi:MAG: MFS transporter [Planctomycetota bacterium]|nr:MFS transporter [Planctomycetota bacterium]